MKVINWLDLQLTESDIDKTFQDSEKILPIRVFIKKIIKEILLEFPWVNRSDTVDLFNPSRKYSIDEYIAIPYEDYQELRPTSWKIGKVTIVDEGTNFIQGSFQVISLKFDGNSNLLAADIDNAKELKISPPISDDDALESLIYEILNSYESFLISQIHSYILDKNLNIEIYKDNVILGQISDILSYDQLRILKEYIQNQSTADIIISIVRIVNGLKQLFEFKDFNEIKLSLLIEKYLLENNFEDLGNHQWITTDNKHKLNRPIQKIPVVPRNSSILTDLLNITETELEIIEDSDLSDEALQDISEYGEEEDSTEEYFESWEPPTSAIKLPILTYQNILEGFFSLSKNLKKAFPPSENYYIAKIQIIDGDYFNFIVDYSKKKLKIDENFILVFRDKFQTAGIKLWIEYQHDNNYRIYPKALEKPVYLTCKIARWDEKFNLEFSEEEIPVHYEYEKNIFRAEIRHFDKEALFKEAENCKYSIQDCILLAFQDLTEINGDGLIHYNELFNAVFFKYRMCSPNTVISLLYKIPCFVPIENGYFKLDSKLGLEKPPKPRILESAGQNVSGKSKSGGLAEDPKQTKLKTKYFIFQQKPESDSEYDDRTGEIYSWRQGIPGSNQITLDSKFIYYRPGVKVFFGKGRLDTIISREGENGDIYHDGQIEDFDLWDPPLDLSWELFQNLSFYDDRRIWVGQMGIRKITKNDYETIIDYYDNVSRKHEYTSQLNIDQNLSCLIGEELFTLSILRSFKIVRIGEESIEIETSTGNSRIIQFNALERSWDHLVTHGSLTRVAIRDKFSNYNPAYVAAILSHFPNVSFNSNPITLYYPLKNDHKSIIEYYEEKMIKRVNHKTFDLIEILTRLIDEELVTLVKKKPFKVINVSEQRIDIKTSGGKTHGINFKEIYLAWMHLFEYGSLSTKEILQHYSNNPTYVFGVLSHFPGVTHISDPITLFYDRYEPPKYDDDKDDSCIFKLVNRLKNQQLYTLCRKVPFMIDEINEKTIHITSRSTEHKIKISIIEQSWSDLKKLGDYYNGFIWSKYSHKSSEYIIAILSHLDGVTYISYPLQLFYSTKTSS
ncbi:MAG: hypothetical protein ACTSQ8_20005 [Candidatus Helarchaeota archaeon]